MKKSCFGVLIGLFLFSGSFIALKASALSLAGRTGAGNSGEAVSSGAMSAQTDVGSLPGALRSVLSKTLGADNPGYRLTRSGGEYRALNARNRLSASIGLEGFTVRAGANEWGLRLTAWGPGRCLKKVEAGRAVSGSNRVAIDRGGIVEWWINGPVGIEQGWTVANRPPPGEDRGPLTLVLRQSGDLRTQALANGRSLCVSSNTGREVLRYTGLTAYDKNGKQLPAHFEVRQRVVRVVVDDTSAAYPVRIDPWVQAARLTVSDGAAGDRLGYSVAVSADGATVVAGAPYETIGNHGGQGAVYVFEEPASGWANGTQVARLTASDGATDDALGDSVAVSADGSTIVAGADYKEVAGNARQGSVYVFKKPPSGWADATQTAKFNSSIDNDYDYFGKSVAVNSDGSTIVAGAYATEGSYGGPGAVYVFKEPASGWQNQTGNAMLTASDGAAGDGFGDSVAVSSDGSTVVAGSSASEGSNLAQGAVYVFEKPASGWASETETARLTASDGAAEDRLGYSVAVSSDAATIVAGANNAVSGQGALYVFEEPASGWASETQTARLTAPDAAVFKTFGYSVAVSSEATTVAAGAFDPNSGQAAVYVFEKPSSGWASETESATLTASDVDTDYFFGRSVAVSADGATVVAGAGLATVGSNSEQGAVYVFQSGSLWQNAKDLGSGWKWLSWFGYFNTSYSPWIYHMQHGWLYVLGTSTDSIWFYDSSMGTYWWTSATLYPYVYRAGDGAWLWYQEGTANPRWFYNLKTKQWERD